MRDVRALSGRHDGYGDGGEDGEGLPGIVDERPDVAGRLAVAAGGMRDRALCRLQGEHRVAQICADAGV